MSDINENAVNQQHVTQGDEQKNEPESQGETLNRNLTTPGRLLRTARDNKELAISTVGKQLKLDTRVIEALERDDFDSIGAPVFVKGHLRKYARFVDINPDDVMLAYYQVARAQDATPIISQTMPMTDSRPKFAWLSKLLTALVVFGLIAALIYGLYRGWNWYLADAESSANESVVSVADSNLNLPSREDVQIATSNNASIQTQASQTLNIPPKNSLQTSTVVNTNAFVNGNSTDIDSANANTQAANSEAPQNTQITSSAETQGVVADANGANTDSSAAQTETGDTLRLVFVENSWVNIKGNSGRSLMNGIGYQGDSRDFVLKGDTEIHLGNADGVQLFLNGNPYAVPSRARSGKTAHFELVPRQ